MNTKKVLERLYVTMGLLRVASVCFAALYCVFWFYRFFNAPGTEFLIPVFDFFAKAIPVPFETLNVDEKHTAENAYFVAAVVLGIMAFVFMFFEDVVLRLERQRDLREIREKMAQEDKMNRELRRDYIKDIMKYKYFSVLIQLKIKYLNELLKETSSCSVDEILDRTYAVCAGLIQRNTTGIVLKRSKNTIFIKSEGFKNFDRVLDNILNAIKTVKIENEKNSIKTDFMIVVDGQKTEAECSSSVKFLLNIAKTGYWGKATATLSFKTRFDLIQDKSKYMTDATGFFVSSPEKEEEEELFVLKTKPESIN